jgi:GT2 family glycosyltransferase
MAAGIARPNGSPPSHGRDRVRIVKLRRNYGQAPAMAAGIEHAQGESWSPWTRTPE